MAEKEAIHKAKARTLNIAGAFSLAGVAVTPSAADLNTLQGQALAGGVKRLAVVPLGVVNTAGGIFAWQNPEAVAIAVNRLTIDIKTVSSGACTIDAGTTATNATTLSDNLVDGLDARTAVYTGDNITDASTNGKAVQKLAAGKWVTGSTASGSAAGLVGFAYIEYIVLS